MSRLGKRPVLISEGVSVDVASDEVVVKGPKGELRCPYDPLITVSVDGNQVVFTRSDDSKDSKAKHGLYRVLVQNMVIGVTSGFEKNLELVGIGYRAQKAGKDLKLSLGFSHEVSVSAPDGVEFELDGNTKIKIKGIDKQLVGQVASDIRKLRPPEPYKGKGVRYADEVIIKKQGKSVKK